MKKTIYSKIVLLFFFVALLFSFTFLNRKEKNSIGKVEGTKHPKAFMLEEMYKQWKEMLQNPEGNIPVDKGFNAWKYAGKMMENQFRNQLQNRFATITWNSRGPNNVGGRTRCLLVSPNDVTGNTVFCGSASGGLWKSTNMKSASPNWFPVDDFMENLSVASLAYDPTNTQIFYAGTGEGFNSADVSRGFGIMKSTNGGNTWNFLPSSQNSAFYYVNKIVVTAGGVVIAATNSGIMRSFDGGATWNTQLSGAFGDLEKAANGILFTASKGPTYTGVYRSTDDGTTWIQSNTGLPTGLSNYSRYELATAPSDANRIYVMVYNHSAKVTGFYKSTNGGLTYVQVGTPVDADTNISSTDITRGQGWYNLIIKVDPNNADIVYTGGIDLFKSINAGGVWTQLSHWYGGFSKQNVHADQHFIEFEGSNSNVIYFTNDGGIYQTKNGSTAVPAITACNNGYNVTQFYAFAMHPSANSNFYIAGSQDNGTQRFTLPGFGGTVQATGGDGAYCNIDQLSPDFMFSQYVYNNYYRSTDGGNSFFSVGNVYNNTGRFINPSRYDDVTKALYASTNAGQFLRWSNANTGTSFTTITVTAMGTEQVSAIAVSPVISDQVYLGTGGGQVVEISNASTVSGTVAGRSLGRPAAGYINCIWQDPGNSDHMMIVYTGFGRNNIYETNNASAETPAWVEKDGDLPDMPVFWLIAEPGNTDNSVLIATEYGVWSTDNFQTPTPNWVITSNGLSRCRVTQLYYRANDNTLAASTYGRGLFTATFIPGTNCGVPGGLNESSTTTTSATVNWLGVNSAESYDVDYKPDSSTNWINIATASTSLFAEINGLTPNTTYDWRVRATCQDGISGYTQRQFTTLTPCGTPTGLNTTAIGALNATANWLAVTGASSYSVDYKLASSTTWVNAATATSSLSVILTGLTPSSLYDWRTRVNCSGTTGNYSQAQFTTTAPPACGTITGLKTSSITYSSAIATWSALSGAGNYAVDYKLNSATTWINAATGNTTRTVTLSNLTASTFYIWRVRPVCLGYPGPYSQLQFTTAATPTCGTVTGLLTSAITATSATFAWSALTGAGSYDMDYKSDTATNWINLLTASTLRTKSIAGLTPSTIYKWRVRANCTNGATGAYSQSQFVTLPPPCPDILEPNNTLTAAAPILTGINYNAVIAAKTDYDYFSFQNKFDSLQIKITLSTMPANYDLKLYNPAGTLIATSANTVTTNEIIIYNAPQSSQAGTYKIYVYGNRGVFNTTQCYTLRVELSATNFTGSNIINENIGGGAQTTVQGGVKIFPVPATDEVNVSFDAAGKDMAEILIIDQTGKVMMKKTVLVNSGINFNKLDISGLSRGAYIVKISVAGDVKMKKFIVQK